MLSIFPARIFTRNITRSVQTEEGRTNTRKKLLVMESEEVQEPAMDEIGRKKHSRLTVARRLSIAIPKPTYRPQKALGYTDTSSVFVAENTITSTKHALKKVSKVIPKNDVRNEVEIMARVAGHPNVVSLHDAYEDRNHYNIVMEFLKGASLTELLLRHRIESEYQASLLIRCMLLAIQHIHKLGVVHRDLKPSNFVFSASISSASLEAEKDQRHRQPLAPKAAAAAAAASTGMGVAMTTETASLLSSSSSSSSSSSPSSLSLSSPLPNQLRTIKRSKSYDGKSSHRSANDALVESLAESIKLVDFGVARRVADNGAAAPGNDDQRKEVNQHHTNRYHQHGRRCDDEKAGPIQGGSSPLSAAGTLHFMAPEVMELSKRAMRGAGWKRRGGSFSTTQHRHHGATDGSSISSSSSDSGRGGYLISAKPGELGRVLKAADMWSLGVIAFLMVRGYPPFDGPDPNVVVRKIMEGRFDIGPFSACSDEFRDFISRLLTVDPYARMTVDEALLHPWILRTSSGKRDRISVDVRASLQTFFTKSRLKRVVAKCVRNQLTASDEAYLRQIFFRFDGDGDGVLARGEVVNLMAFLGFGPESLLMAKRAVSQARSTSPCTVGAASETQPLLELPSPQPSSKQHAKKVKRAATMTETAAHKSALGIEKNQGRSPGRKQQQQQQQQQQQLMMMITPPSLPISSTSMTMEERDPWLFGGRGGGINFQQFEDLYNAGKIATSQEAMLAT